jgi:hypothetical protein
LSDRLLPGHHAVSPPTWGRPTYPCPRCGSPAPYNRFELASLRRLRWQLFTAVQIVNWCGHAQECLVLPAFEEGWTQLVPVLGETT